MKNSKPNGKKKHDGRQYSLYKDALTDGLEKLKKYYSQLDKKPSFVLVLGNDFIFILVDI
jgi:hypothetical protein